MDVEYARWQVTTGVSLTAALIAVIALFVSIAQVSINRDTEKRTLRAYIYAVPGINDFTIGKKPSYTIDIKNGGQTPAYDFSISLNSAIMPYPQKELFAGKGVQPTAITATKDGIGAFIYKDHDSQLNLFSGEVLTDKDYNDVMKGTERRIYIWGRLLYLDAFAEDHYLNFCFTMDGASIVKNKSLYCADYNDTDHTPSSRNLPNQMPIVELPTTP